MLVFKSSSLLVSYQEMPTQECEAVVQQGGEITELVWKFVNPEPDYCYHLYFKMDGWILSLGMEGRVVDHLYLLVQVNNYFWSD